MAKEKFHYIPKKYSSIMNPIARQFFWILLWSIPYALLALVKKFIPRRKKSLAWKTVLITGSGSGLGRAMALEFAKHKSVIICVDINKEGNEKTVQEIVEQTGDPDSAKSYICDVSDVEAVKKLAEEVHKKYYQVDILINNAGIIYGKTILKEEEAMAKKVLNVNLLANYWMVRSFLPKMKEKNEGHIVFINSIASMTPLGEASMYTITKYGLLGLSDSLLDEFSRDPQCKKIKISSVHPFFIGTEGLKAMPLAPQLVMMRVEEAAKIIVDGVRWGYASFTVPGFETGYTFMSLARLIPLKLYRKLANRVYNKIVIPEEANNLLLN